MDGTNRKIIVVNDGVRVADIALDLDNSRIYWCVTTADKIESADYDGLNRKVVYTGKAESHVHSPIVGNGRLYWIEMAHQTGSIMSLPLNNMQQVQVVKKNLGITLKDLALFGKGRQKGNNPCRFNNGGCQDLCLFNGSYPVCICKLYMF